MAGKATIRGRVYNITDQQYMFVLEYLKDLDANAAALRAGYSPNAARAAGSELVGKKKIRDVLELELSLRSVRTQTSADRVVRELARIAFVDPRNVMRWDAAGVAVIDSSKIDDDTAAAIQEIKLDAQGNVSVKLVPKLPALDMLAKHLNLYAKNNQVEVGPNLLDLVAKIHDRAEEAKRQTIFLPPDDGSE